MRLCLHGFHLPQNNKLLELVVVGGVGCVCLPDKIFVIFWILFSAFWTPSIHHILWLCHLEMVA